MDPTAILIVSSMLIIFLTVVSVSYKTGFVAYSIWSFTSRNQPKFEVNKNKIGNFIGVTIGVFLLNVVYGLAILRDIREIEGILLFALFNTTFIAYGLSYWMLINEKRRS